MKEYQGFAISNFRTGFDESVEPWLLPRDGYQSVVNARLYRGVLEKVDGYLPYAHMSNRNQIIMSPAPDGMNTIFTVTLPTLPVTTAFYGYGTLVLGSTAETFQYSGDASSTVINLVGSSGGTGTVNLTTTLVTLNFNTAPPAGTYSNVFFQWDSAPANTTAIMGIQQYFKSDGGQEVMVFDQLRMGIIIPISGTIAQTAGVNQGIKEVPHDYLENTVITGNGMTLTFTGTLTNPVVHTGILNIAFNEYTAAGAFVPSLSPIIDNGFGGLSGPNVDATNSFINYATGAWQITFTVAPANTNVFDVTYLVYGDLFTGSISNFFTVTNYRYFAFFTNSIDAIYYYDGIAIHYLNTNLIAKRVQATLGIPNNLDITACLHVFTYRERLLLISPTDSSLTPSKQVAAIYWSVAGNPLDFTVANGSGNLTASTSEPIRTFGYINTDLIIRFSTSERVFRYTADAFSPFRWDSTNNLWACDAPYSSINYDSWFSSVGKPAVVGSDGVNVKRVDMKIPDFTDPSRIPQDEPVPFMNQNSIQQCYGERFDDIKEGWTCYNSDRAAQTEVTASNNVLAFNYLDETYSVYSFPLSCLGYGYLINTLTWGTTFTAWGSMGSTWGSYQLQANSLIDLGGDQFDTVFELNDGNVQTNEAGDTVPVLMDVFSKNFNPFIEQGQLSRLGYVDLLVSADNDSTLRVQFYANDQLYLDSAFQPQGFYQETKLIFNSTDAMSPIKPQTKVWKRIYVGSVAKEHTLRFYQNVADFTVTNDQPIYIHAMVLYFKPAGRIFN